MKKRWSKRLRVSLLWAQCSTSAPAQKLQDRESQPFDSLCSLTISQDGSHQLCHNRHQAVHAEVFRNRLSPLKHPPTQLVVIRMRQFPHHAAL